MLPIFSNTQAISTANREAQGKNIKHNRATAKPSVQEPGSYFCHAHKHNTSMFIILR